MDNKASIAGVYGARTTDQREIRIERQGRRNDTSVEPVGLQACPDRGRANRSRLLHNSHHVQALLVTDGTETDVQAPPVRKLACSQQSSCGCAISKMKRP
jgi:hypothetical protein